MFGVWCLVFGVWCLVFGLQFLQSSFSDKKRHQIEQESIKCVEFSCSLASTIERDELLSHADVFHHDGLHPTRFTKLDEAYDDVQKQVKILAHRDILRARD